MLGWVAGEMPHAAEGDVEKYCGCAKETPAEGPQEVYDRGSRLEAPYGASQRHMVALARQQYGLSDAGFPWDSR